MPGYDWALLADRGGEALESLIATFLVLEHPSARQVNPSQGDGGVDILLETDDGIEVWQVKKFTRPLTAGQWSQVRNSWQRFKQEFVDNGVRVARYHLVTPWTPSRERYAEFEAMTRDVPFATQWDGDAFINGMADAHPATMDRFVHGPGAYERFVTERSLLAQVPIERAETMTMSQAIGVRQSAIDDLRDSLSDTYRIDYGTRTVSTPDSPPMPDANDPAIYHRMTYLGQNRWRTESIVPRHSSAAEIDPVQVEITFMVTENSPEHQAVRDWEEWGTPLTDIPARTRTRGGPFDGETHDNVYLSNLQLEQDFPALFFVVRNSAHQVRLRRQLTVLTRSRGVRTGWFHIVAETPMRALHFELKVKPENGSEFTGTLGNVDGLDPREVLSEIDEILAVDPSDNFSIELQNGLSLTSGSGMVSPDALASMFRPIAHGLSELQRSTTHTLVMPNVLEVTMGQFGTFKSYVAIYGGSPAEWTWSSATLTVPNNTDEAAGFLQNQLPDLINGRTLPVILEQPLIKLAEREFLIERPLVTTRRSLRVEIDGEVESLSPGDTIRLTPGEDDGVVTAAVVDWTPGSIDAFQNGTERT